jgi:hypothetical protein
VTTTSKAAGDGATTTTETATEADARPDRLTGMAQVREAAVYHTCGVMHDAIFEAYRLSDAIHRAVSGAYFDTRTAAETVESSEVQDKISEAIDCLCIARNSLERLLGEPPF